MDNDIINVSEENIILLENINIPNILNKLTYYKNIIQSTLISTQNLKKIDILTANNIKISHSKKVSIICCNISNIICY